MDGMGHFSPDEWIQQYPNNTAMAQAVGGGATSSSTPVIRDSSQAGEAGPKPIRRRSRASRRTPVTVLNASPTDFRALVQRFTGCDSKPLDVSLPKGPVNIDFARNDQISSSSRYAYFDNQVVRPSREPEQVQQVSSWNHLQAAAGYGIENNASAGMYESIDESSLMSAQRDGGSSHGYHNV